MYEPEHSSTDVTFYRVKLLGTHSEKDNPAGVSSVYGEVSSHTVAPGTEGGTWVRHPLQVPSRFSHSRT